MFSWSLQGNSDSLLEYLIETLLVQICATFVVAHCPDNSRHSLSILFSDSFFLHCSELRLDIFVVSEILFSSDQYLGDPRGVVGQLRPPLRLDVVEADRGDNGEADDEDVRVGVGESPQGLVVLLPGRVPQLQHQVLPAQRHGVGVVVEHGGDVVGGEGARGEGDQHPSLADLAVPTDNTLDVHGDWPGVG